MSSSEITGLRAAESQTAAQSTVLRRELSLADLALAQILIVIVPEFFGTAVKAGPSHVVLWLLAIDVALIALGAIAFRRRDLR